MAPLAGSPRRAFMERHRGLTSSAIHSWWRGLGSSSSRQLRPCATNTTAQTLARRRPLHRMPVALVLDAGRRREFSSYEWKNMSKYAQEANKDFAQLSGEEIRIAGETEIDKVEKALKAMEPFNDVFKVRRDGLEVFAELAPHVGTYWIKFDLSMKQICMMSPRSGPHRYIYDKGSGRWIGEADKHDFQGMLTRDIIQSACGIPDF